MPTPISRAYVCLGPGLLGRWFARARTLLALLALAGLLGAPSARAYSLFRCAYSDVVMTSCCCPAADQAHPSSPQLTRAGCCKVERVSGTLGTGRIGASEAAAGVPRIALATAAQAAPARFVSAYTELPEKTPAARFRMPSRAGPPLTIVHRRLLI